jgi:exonuclease VII small subunit
MLTTQDLNSIGELIDEKIDPLKEDVSSLKQGQDSLKQGQDSLKKNVTQLKKGQRELEKGQKELKNDINTMAKFFDDDYIKLRRRVDRIENHLNLSPIQPN